MIRTSRPRRAGFKINAKVENTVQPELSPRSLILWKAVLMQALDDLKRFKEAEENGQFYLHDPRGWFDSQSEAMGSFWWVCRVIGLDTTIIRSEIIGLLGVPVGEDHSEDGVA